MSSQQFLQTRSLRDGYQMCGSASYIMPSGESSLADVRNMILSLPDSETPEVFGMHENASITYRQQQTRILLDTIITMSNSGGGGSDEDAGANEREVMAATTAMMERLPEVAFELSRAQAHLQKVRPAASIHLAYFVDKSASSS